VKKKKTYKTTWDRHQRVFTSWRVSTGAINTRRCNPKPRVIRDNKEKKTSWPVLGVTNQL